MTPADDAAIPLDAQVCFSLYTASIAVNRLYKPILDSLGITYPQYLVLSSLWERDGQTISAIAARLSLESSTITPLVKRLENAGLVRRQRGTQDERLVQVFLTGPGRDLRRETSCLPRTLLDKSGFGVEEIVALNAQLQRLCKALGTDS